MEPKRKSELSEKQKGVYRIGTNYGRLLATMAMGIATVPLQFKWLGVNGFGLLGLIGSSVGIGAMLQDMMRSSMVRELGAAWHKDDTKAFREIYAASFQVSSVVSLLTALAFTVIIFILPFLNIQQDWIGPAQWILACEGLATCFIVLLSPTINMLVVREQFFWHNAWTVVRRSAYLIATVIPFLVLQESNLAQGLIVYGNTIFIINVVATVFVVLGFILVDKNMVPTLRGSTPLAMKKVKGTFSWNSSVVLAINLQERAANFIMNIFFGSWGNAVFTLALRLVSYIRMATLGLTFGLDSVSARLSSNEDKSSLRSMFNHSTRMLSFIAFPAMVLVFVLAEPLLRLWVGRSTKDPELVLPQAEFLVKIMVLGLACRAVSDGWMKLFFGAGFIRKYAPYVLAGGIFNPILSIGFILLLPKSWNYTGAAVAYTLVFLTVNMIIMPVVTSSKVNLTYKEIITPIFRPLLIAVVASPCLLAGHYISTNELLGWIEIVIGVASYGAVYVFGCWWFMFTKRERSGLLRLGFQLVGR